MGTIFYGIRVLTEKFCTSKKVRIRAKGEICTVEPLAKATQALARMDQALWFKLEIEACRDLATLPNGSPLASFNPFLDIDGILRVGGRLKRANLGMGQKYPIILAKDGRLAYMIVANAHRQLLHGGVQAMLHHIRQTHWMIGGRALVEATGDTTSSILYQWSGLCRPVHIALGRKMIEDNDKDIHRHVCMFGNDSGSY